MTRLIADDFPAIRARLASLKGDEGAAPADPRADPRAASPPEPAAPAAPAEFHAWLGRRWAAPSGP